MEFIGKFQTTTVCSSDTSLISFFFTHSLCVQPQPYLPLLFLKHDKNVSTSGPAHLLFTLPERVFLPKDIRLIYSPLTSLLNVTSSQRAFLTTGAKTLPFPSTSLSALLCLVFHYTNTHTQYSLSGCIYSSFPSHTCSQINSRSLAHCRYFIHVF